MSCSTFEDISKIDSTSDRGTTFKMNSKIPHLLNTIKLIEEEIGYENVSEIDDNLSSLSISEGPHKISVLFSPNNPPAFKTELPIQLPILPSDSISTVISAWKKLLLRLDPFYNCLSELDQETWVLESAHKHRRISLSRCVSSSYL